MPRAKRDERAARWALLSAERFPSFAGECDRILAEEQHG
jgi:hypothetical protein